MASIQIDAAFEETPTSVDKVKNTPVYIQQSRKALAERVRVEHEMDIGDTGSQLRHGLHKAGSAVPFYQDSAPTTRNGVSLNALDNGLLWLKTSTAELYKWATGAWAKLSDASVSANTLVLRDGAGRAKVAEPSATTDIALLSTVNTAATNAANATAALTNATNAHANLAAAHGASTGAYGNTLIFRDAGGRADIVSPTGAANIANKSYVDGILTVARSYDPITWGNETSSPGTLPAIKFGQVLWFYYHNTGGSTQHIYLSGESGIYICEYRSYTSYFTQNTLYTKVTSGSVSLPNGIQAGSVAIGHVFRVG